MREYLTDCHCYVCKNNNNNNNNTAQSKGKRVEQSNRQRRLGNADMDI